MNGVEDTRTRTIDRSGSRPLAWAVLLAAVLQVVAPLVTLNGPGASPDSGSGEDLLITPVGWAFSIWGVIYALAIAQAVAVLARGAGAVPRRLQVGQLVLYLGGTLWITVAAIGSSLATAATLVLMAVAAADAVVVAGRRMAPSGWFALLTRTAVGLYAGWVTAALFLNLSTALVAFDVVEADVLPWQLVVLVVAVAALVTGVAAARGVLAYAAAGCWALLGIGVTGASQGTPTVTALAVVSGALLVAATVLVRRRTPSPGPRTT